MSAQDSRRAADGSTEKMRQLGAVRRSARRTLGYQVAASAQIMFHVYQATTLRIHR